MHLRPSLTDEDNAVRSNSQTTIFATMGKKDRKSDHRKRSGKSRQTHDDDIPIDPNLFEYQGETPYPNTYYAAEPGPSGQDDPSQDQ